MNLIEVITKFFLHADVYLTTIIANFGPLVYLFLFTIIFIETGFVIMPFLPGDSLLFVAGALAAAKSLNIFILFILLSLAAILGDSLNYSLGSYIGQKVFKYEKSFFFRKEYLIKTQQFYEKHGGKTIILARFMPFARTFAPFIAGIGKMSYPRFLSFNIIGGLLWVTLFLFAGYFFGTVPFVKENLTLVILLIIFLSILPGIIIYIKEKLKKH